MSNMQSKPIGVFDSGLGGLTVVKQLMKDYPKEDIVYFGDTARVPYGTKSKETIINFSIENTERLIKHNVKMVVVACNSSSSYALECLREKFSIPIVDVIEPGVKKAVLMTKNKKIGIIATSATINSNKYVDQIKQLDQTIKIHSNACPLFVPIVEEGWANKKEVWPIIKEYLKPLVSKKIDTLILGCTHYPLLKNVIKKQIGEGVYLVDSAKQVSINVGNVLKKDGLFNQCRSKAKYNFIISDKPQAFEKTAQRFLGQKIKFTIER